MPLVPPVSVFKKYATLHYGANHIEALHIFAPKTSHFGPNRIGTLLLFDPKRSDFGPNRIGTLRFWP